MVDNSPIIAKIVIDNSGASGLGSGQVGGSAGMKGKLAVEDNKNLKEMTRLLNLMTLGGFGSDKDGKTFGISDLIIQRIVGTAIVAVAGVMGTYAMAETLGGGMGDPEGGTGQYVAPTTSWEEAEAVAEEMGTTLELVQEQNDGLNKGVETITTDHIPIQDKITAELSKTQQYIIDENGELKLIKGNFEDITTNTGDAATESGPLPKAFQDMVTALDLKTAEINSIKVPTIGVGKITEDGGVTFDGEIFEPTSSGNLAAINYAGGSEVKP